MIVLDFLALRLRADITPADARALDAFDRNCRDWRNSTGPHAGGKWSELSPELQAAVTNEVRLMIGERDERVLRGERYVSDDYLYWSVLGTFGLDCPHPRTKLCDRGSRPNPDITECEICGTITVAGETARRYPLTPQAPAQEEGK